MRQVPEFRPDPGPQYCLFGNGRVARHFSHYFTQLGLPFWHWKEPRRLDSEFFRRLPEATHLLLLVSDSAIERILGDLPSVDGQTRVHFSGATRVNGAHSAHPLQTFGSELYSLDEYRKIHFVLTRGENPVPFADLLPGLPNPNSSILESDQALYHALCVMAGNFPMILWAEVLARFEALGLTRDAAAPYLERVLQNSLSAQGQENLTGPIVRGDWATIDRHLATLENDRLRALYLAFVHFFSKEEDSHDHRTRV